MPSCSDGVLTLRVQTQFFLSFTSLIAHCSPKPYLLFCIQNSFRVCGAGGLLSWLHPQILLFSPLVSDAVIEEVISCLVPHITIGLHVKWLVSTSNETGVGADVRTDDEFSST